MHVGQTEVSTLEAVRELCVIEAEQVEDGRVEVVDVDAVGHGVETQFVGFTQSHPRLDPTAGQPHGKGIGVVVSAVITALHHRRAAKLATPDDQGILKHSALFQVLNQGRAGLIGVLAILLQAVDEVAMLVPSFMKNLDKADTAFGEPAGKQAGVGKR